MGFIKNSTKRVCNLPVRHGGLGLRSVHRTKSTAWCVSFLRCYERLKSLSFFSSDDDATLESVRLFVEETIENFDDLDRDSIPTIRDVLDKEYKKEREDLLKDMFDQGL